MVIALNSSKSNILPTTIWFGADSLRIDIDGSSETFEWAKKHIDEDRNAVIELIKNLFTGYVSVELRGASKFIQIFDSNGFFCKCTFSQQLATFLYGFILIS